MMTQAPTPEEDTWVVGVGPIPEWVTEIQDFDAFVDEHGNAYFQFEDSAVLVPKGGVIEKQNGLILFGNHWAIAKSGEVLHKDGERGWLYLPDELPNNNEVTE
jgi:hypothetical protein